MGYLYADLNKASSALLIQNGLVGVFNAYLNDIQRPGFSFSARMKDDGIIAIETDKECFGEGKSGLLVKELVSPPIFPEIERFQGLNLAIRKFDLPFI
jgi:hypothetical protein